MGTGKGGEERQRASRVEKEKGKGKEGEPWIAPRSDQEKTLRKIV